MQNTPEAKDHLSCMPRRPCEQNQTCVTMGIATNIALWFGSNPVPNAASMLVRAHAAVVSDLGIHVCLSLSLCLGAEREPRNRCACLCCHRPGGGIGKFKDPAPMQADPDAITAIQHAAHLSPWPRRVGPRLGKSAGADGCAVDESIRLEPCAEG